MKVGFINNLEFDNKIISNIERMFVVKIQLITQNNKLNAFNVFQLQILHVFLTATALSFTNTPSKCIASSDVSLSIHNLVAATKPENMSSSGKAKVNDIDNKWNTIYHLSYNTSTVLKQEMPEIPHNKECQKWDCKDHSNHVQGGYRLKYIFILFSRSFWQLHVVFQSQYLQSSVVLYLLRRFELLRHQKV
jgi:hypothetical protein